MTGNLTQKSNDVVSGEESQDILIGQGTIVAISAPTIAGQVIEQRLENGQQVVLDFDATSVTPSIEGPNFVLSFNGIGDGAADSKLVFLDLVDQARSGDAPVLVINGNEISADQLIGQALALVAGDTLETAAGPATGAQSGGGSQYSDDTGESIDLLNSSGVLGGTETENRVLTIARDDTAESAVVAGKDGNFGDSYTIVFENSADSANTPVNNSFVTAVDLTDRSQWGPVNDENSVQVKDSSLSSILFKGRIDNSATEGGEGGEGGEDDNDSSRDYDYIAVSLRAGERLIIDIDNGEDPDEINNDPESVDTRVSLFDADGNEIAENDDASMGLGGAGSSDDYDSYLEYTVPADGIYYIRVKSYNNNDSGSYDLWLTIDNSGVDGTQVIGSDADETLVGSDGNDVISGNGGEDLLVGGAGNDLIYGGQDGGELIGDTAQEDGAGNIDGLTATGGDDTLVGLDGDYYMVGDFDFRGNDVIGSYITGGNDTLTSGDGDDTLIGDMFVDDDFGEDGGGDIVDGSFQGGDDVLVGGEGDDILVGDAKIDDDIESSASHSLIGGDDILEGGEGEDTLIGDLLIADDIETGPHTVIGGDDSLDGGDDDDDLVGDFFIGDDVEGGGNSLTGGDDTLTGGQGDDTLTGDFLVDDDVEAGATLTGGSDTFVFSLAGSGDGDDTITDFESDRDVLHFTDVVDGGEAGLDLNDLNAMIAGITDDGTDVVVNFNNGASITFEDLGTGAINSIDDLVNDPANQIIID